MIKNALSRIIKKKKLYKLARRVVGAADIKSHASLYAVAEIDTFI